MAKTAKAPEDFKKLYEDTMDALRRVERQLVQTQKDRAALEEAINDKDEVIEYSAYEAERSAKTISRLALTNKKLVSLLEALAVIAGRKVGA